VRVALVASLVSPIRPAEANGPHAVIRDLAAGLSDRGHAVTVWAAEGSIVDGVALREVPVEAAAAGASFQAGGGRPPPAAIAALDRAFARLFAALRADAPDAVSQHAFDVAAIELAEGLPVLHTLHLPPTVASVVAAARRSRAPLATVSEAAARRWRAAGLGHISVLRNGVPIGPPDDGAPPEPVALVAGRISPEKGTDAAIRVARRAGLGLRVVGDVYDAAYHVQRVEPLLRPGEFLGPLPRHQLASLMARAAVFVMPIRWDEPFGLVAAEAQMAGCPVVAYRRGALPEIVEDGVGGCLVQPDDEDALVAAIRQARSLDRPAIRRRAERELGLDRMIDGYEHALVTIARAAGRSNPCPPAGVEDETAHGIGLAATRFVASL
jgi:glycosyltransferase involved in cell wall biosynthesis